MDIAREELMKKPDEISVEKLQSLLDLALRSTVAVADPFHEDLTCCVEQTTLLKRLSTLKDLEISQTVSSSSDLEEPVSITGLETFSLSYKMGKTTFIKRDKKCVGCGWSFKMWGSGNVKFSNQVSKVYLWVAMPWHMLFFYFPFDGYTLVEDNR